MVLILSIVLSTNAEAARRSLRVDIGAWSEDYVIGSENCPATAELESDVSWEGFRFAGDPLREDRFFYLVDSYCQTSLRYQPGMTDSEYLNAAIFFGDEAGLAAKVGTNTGNNVRAIRYAFLDADRSEGGDGYQYAFYFFGNDVTLVTVYGNWVSSSYVEVLMSGRDQLHWNGPYDGEYFCFGSGKAGIQFFGVWDGSPAGTGAAAGCEPTSTTTEHRTFSMEAEGLSQSICVPDDFSETYIDVISEYWFSEDVYLSTVNLPTGFDVTFEANPLQPLGSNNTLVFISMDDSVVADSYNFEIQGSSGDIDKSLEVQIDVFDSIPESPSPSFPADTATGIVFSPILQWSGVPQQEYYLVEVDDDPAFGSIDFSAYVSGTEVKVTNPLSLLTTYYWRVSAGNTCGSSAKSSTYSFTTFGPLIMRDGFE